MRASLRQFVERAGGVLTVALVINAASLWVAILVQAAFAGSFLGGGSDALAWHERNAMVIGFAALGQLVLATLGVFTRHARWPVSRRR